MHIWLTFFGYKKTQIENEIHWIMFYNYQSKSKDVHFNGIIWFLSVASS